MNIVLYALVTYGITVAISLLVVVIIVMIGKIMGTSGKGANDHD